MCRVPSNLNSRRFFLLQTLRRRRRLSTTLKEKKMKALKKDIEHKNLKLYLMNKSIIEANEKLREKAHLLLQENQTLLSQLQHKLALPLV